MFPSLSLFSHVDLFLYTYINKYNQILYEQYFHSCPFKN